MTLVSKTSSQFHGRMKNWIEKPQTAYSYASRKIITVVVQQKIKIGRDVIVKKKRTRPLILVKTEQKSIQAPCIHNAEVGNRVMETENITEINNDKFEERKLWRQKSVKRGKLPSTIR